MEGEFIRLDQGSLLSPAIPGLKPTCPIIVSSDEEVDSISNHDDSVNELIVFTNQSQSCGTRSVLCQYTSTVCARVCE